jgi:putative membrane protein
MNSLLNNAIPLAAAIGILLFALPSYISTLKQRGLVRSLGIFLGIGAILIGLESTANLTRIPYGTFAYSDILGYKLFHAVPWSIVFAYIALLLGMFWLATNITKHGLRVLITALLMLVAHTVLHPALTRMQLITWEKTGVFYGMSPVNFAGWFVVAFLSASLLSKFWGDHDIRRSTSYSALGIILFWSGINLGLKQWLPAGIGLALSVFIFVKMRRLKKRERLEAKKPSLQTE